MRRKLIRRGGGGTGAPYRNRDGRPHRLDRVDSIVRWQGDRSAARSRGAVAGMDRGALSQPREEECPSHLQPRNAPSPDLRRGAAETARSRSGRTADRRRLCGAALHGTAGNLDRLVDRARRDRWTKGADGSDLERALLPVHGHRAEALSPATDLPRRSAEDRRRGDLARPLRPFRHVRRSDSSPCVARSSSSPSVSVLTSNDGRSGGPDSRARLGRERGDRQPGVHCDAGAALQRTPSRPRERDALGLMGDSRSPPSRLLQWRQRVFDRVPRDRQEVRDRSIWHSSRSAHPTPPGRRFT